MPGSHQDDTEVKCLVGIVSGGSCALEFEDVEELGVSVGELVEDVEEEILNDEDVDDALLDTPDSEPGEEDM